MEFAPMTLLLRIPGTLAVVWLPVDGGIDTFFAALESGRAK
jgi:hypothetical protein